MRRFLLLAVVLAAASCEPSDKLALAPVASSASTASPMDDGTFLASIDPLGGQWSIERIGQQDFQRFKGWVNFSAGGFLNHGAGCSGGYPAFYRLDGNRLTIIRREAIRIGKCASATTADRFAAAASFSLGG